MTTSWFRFLLAVIASWFWRVAYWVRPYDLLADRRRWRWQRPAPCGFCMCTEDCEAE